jgi:hypothetical protein
MKSHALGMEKLREYFRKFGEKFGNPKVIELEKPAMFDLRRDSNPPAHIALDMC